MWQSKRNQAATSDPCRGAAGVFFLAIVLIGGPSAPASSPKGVDPSGRYLVDGDGRPFFWLGDTAWNLFQIPNREDAEL
jgi:hypothetical protein